LPPFDRVISGSSARPNLCRHISAHGSSERVVVFVEATQWGEVSAVSLTLDVVDAADRESACAVLAALGHRWPLILVDWGWRACIRLDGPGPLNHYLDERVQFFSQAS
jgi:hypothetical protein